MKTILCTTHHPNISPKKGALLSQAFSVFMGSRIILLIMVYTALLVVSSIEAILLDQPQVPCYFIFGDSIVDTGNNNDFKTLAKANYPPYGIDFPEGPTGRFTNGRNIADVLGLKRRKFEVFVVDVQNYSSLDINTLFAGELLGFQHYTPSFANAKGQDIIQGVNYASAAAGIRNDSGRHLGDRISLNRQLQNHQTTISGLATILGSQTSANKHLGKCLYIVVMGSNDYINNYLMPEFYPTSKLYTPDQYAQVLIRQYSRELQNLGPIGCIPLEIEKHGRNGFGCVDSINDAVQLFNDRLKSLVDDLNTNLRAANFSYINTFSIQSLVPAAVGLGVHNQPCCKVSRSTGHCIPDEEPCPVRTLNVFWDKIHPSEVSNLFTAGRAYFSVLPSDAHPVDIRHLAML